MSCTDSILFRPFQSLPQSIPQPLDFNLEKQTLIHKAKLDVHAEFETKEKEREVQARIQKSTELGNSRVQKMKYRDDLLNQLLKDATARAAVISAQPNYPSLLTRLIVQALIKIEETDVVIYCRQADLAMVTKVLPQAVSDLVKLMKEKAGVDVKPNVTVNQNRSKDLETSTGGGIIAVADDGRIVCDNTLEARLNLVYIELLPSIRAILFPEGQ